MKTEVNKKPTYEVIDDFLPSSIFDKLQNLLLPFEKKGGTEEVAWYYVPAGNVVKGVGNFDPTTSDWRLFYLIHMVYNHTITSPLYEAIMPHLKPLDIKALIRLKINMYPNTETFKEHGMHTDLPFSHKAAILSINTCNGYTKLEDGTKIDSVANRMLLFDPSKPHTPSTTTDQPVRVNININYF